MNRLLRPPANFVLVEGVLVVNVVIAAPPQATAEALNPRGKISHPPYMAPNARITDLAGKKIGLY